MNNTANNAATIIENLEKRCNVLEDENAELKAKLNWFMEQLRLSKQRRFGISSERFCPGQQRLFNEDDEMVVAPVLPEQEIETITYKRRKKQRGHREAILKNLPVEVIEYRLSPEEQICDCGNELHEMTKEIRREIKFIPAQTIVVEHVCYSYACRRCDREETETPIVKAPMPAPVLPGSLASPSSIAYIMSQKYVEAMPLYRQEQHLYRMGIQISRQTMANWMLLASERWLEIIYDRMHHYLLEQDILHADETSLQVLREPGRAAKTKSYMWLYRTGREGPPIILYDYQETRGGVHPCSFLKGFKGFLHCDGYPGYNKLDNVVLVGCWSHARRGFTDSLKVLPEANRPGSVAQEGLNACNKLFAIERTLKNVDNNERYEARLKKSRPLLNAFHTWLIEYLVHVLPQSTLGKSIKYCLNQWDKLESFLLDGRLEIDNNRGERSIKPYVIGRKNWLFSNTPRGAKASAIIYSIVETTKENNLNPFAYLCYLFEILPNMDITDTSALDKLLPWSDDIPHNCRVPKKNT